MRRKRRLIILGVAVLLVAGNVAGYLVIRSAWFKNWQAERLGRAALELIKKEEYAEAYQKTAAAMQLSPQAPTVLRASARLHFLSQSPQAAVFYRMLIDAGAADQTDLLDAAEAALALKDYRFYDEVMAILAKSPPALARYYMLQGSHAVVMGDIPLAIRLTREATKLEPGNTDYAVALAQLLLGSGQSAQVEEGRMMLETLARGTEGKLKALRALINAEPIPPAERLQFCDEMLAQPDADVADKLQAAEVAIQLDPARRQTLVPSMIAKYGKGDNEQLKMLGAWLVRIRDPQAAEQLLPQQKALRRQDFFLIWLDAVAGQDRWSDIRAVLSQKNVPLDPPLQQLFLGRADLQLGVPTSAEQHFRKAIHAAERDPVMLVYLAGYFRAIAQQQFEIESLEKLAGSPAYARFAFDGLLSFYRRNGETRKLLKVLERMKARWPEDLAIQNDVTYLKLIFNEQVSAQLFEASKRFEADPSVFPLRMTYALALLRNGQGREAMELLEKSKVKFGEMVPWQRAIFAAILADNGFQETAVAVADGIPDRSLTAQEMDFVASYLSPGKPAATGPGTALEP